MHWLTRTVLAFAALYVVTIFLISEPLGDAAERYLVKLASPLIADLTYHGEPFSLVSDQFLSKRKTAVHQHIVNVVVDDYSLLREESSFPLTYAQYARHLELISQQKPKAIFVDVWFHDKRASDNTMSELVDVICRLANPADGTQKPAIKFYLLSFQPYGRYLHPELQKVSNHNTGPGQPQCFSEVSAVVPMKEAEQKGWYYPFQTCEKQGCIPSAAVAIYNDLLAGSEEQKIQKNEAGNFFLIWSNRTPDQEKLNAFFDFIYDKQMELDTECKNKKSPLHFLNFFLPDMLQFDAIAHNNQVCRPFLQFNTHELTKARQRQHKDTAGKFVREKMMGSVVIYGYDLSGINDFVDSPVHGTTLGLNFHAMAIENLDRIGNGVIRESGYNTFWEHKFSRENYYIMALCLLGALFHAWKQSRVTQAECPASPNLFRHQVWSVIKALLVFMLALLIFIALNGVLLRLDYTVLVEGVFFVLALSSLAYVEAFSKLVNKLCRWIGKCFQNYKREKRE